MKYSEFLQLSEILEAQGSSVSEEFGLEHNHDTLYEGFFSGLFAKLGKLLKKGMSELLSAGIKQTYIQQLNDNANEIVNLVINDLRTADAKKKSLSSSTNTTSKSSNDYKIDVVSGSTLDLIDRSTAEAIEDLKGRYNENTTSYNPKVYDRELKKIERERTKNIRKYATERINAYSEKVKDKIQQNKNLTDEHKKLLINYWRQLENKVHAGLSSQFIKYGIVEENEIEALFAKNWEDFSRKDKDKDNDNQQKPPDASTGAQP